MIIWNVIFFILSYPSLNRIRLKILEIKVVSFKGDFTVMRFASFTVSEHKRFHGFFCHLE